jgi:hypothetical protein
MLIGRRPRKKFFTKQDSPETIRAHRFMRRLGMCHVQQIRPRFYGVMIAIGELRKAGISSARFAPTIREVFLIDKSEAKRPAGVILP